VTHWKTALLLLSLTIFLAACVGEDAFQGTELTARAYATAFELVSETGQTVTLANYDGKIVLLTFLYTTCTDLCPAVTADLRDAHGLLGDLSEDVAFVVISVDPARDTVESAREYSDRWGMTDKWDFLVGDDEALSRLWAAYYIDPVADIGSDDGEEESGSDQHRESSALDRLVEDSYLITHSAPVYLIDRDGVRRILFTPPFEPEALAHDIRLLAD